jgi:gentisate 1,2-dioxygenase
MGQGKDHVKVVDGEQFFLASSEPTLTGCHLAFWAMPIATGVENENTMATTGTLMAMSTQGRGTAVGDSTEHFLVHPVNPAAVIGEESFALRPYDVGHLQVWPIHFFSNLRDRCTLLGLESCN